MAVRSSVLFVALLPFLGQAHALELSRTLPAAELPESVSSLRFSLFDAEDAATPIRVVDYIAGEFRVIQQGEAVELAADLDEDLGKEPLWLETAADGLALGERVPFRAVSTGVTFALGNALNMDGNPVQNLAGPTADTDAATKGYVDAASVSGNAATATALAADGTDCAANFYARGVDAQGNAQGCTPDANSGGTVTSITAGSGLSGGTITTSGTISLDPASTTLTGSFHKQGGNAFGTTAILGTTDNNAVEIRAANQRVMRFEVDFSSPDIISGSSANAVGLLFSGQTIAGGGHPSATCYNPLNGQYDRSCANVTDGNYASVPGGVANRATAHASVAMGGSSTASGFYTVAAGLGATASGDQSIAMGEKVTASGANSTALGIRTVASGNYSTAIGSFTTASGNWSTAMGDSAVASGIRSIAMGYNAKTQTAGGTVHDGAFVWADNQNLGFYTNAANEFAARATGGVRFVTAIDGSGTPTRTFSINNGGAVSASGRITGNDGVTGITGDYIALYGIDNSANWPAVEGWNQGTGELLRLWAGSDGSQQLRFRVYNNGNAWMAGTLTQVSDGRLKTDVAPLEGALEKLVQLRGVSYAKEDDPDRVRQIGIIAQELEQVYPELVSTDEQGMKAVAYANLSAVLIEAVKEQQAQIQQQQAEIAALRVTLAQQDTKLRQLSDLAARVGALETAPRGGLRTVGSSN